MASAGQRANEHAVWEVTVFSVRPDTGVYNEGMFVAGSRLEN
jgi:hypothetical protein